jgi:RNase P subunit RPR2
MGSTLLFGGKMKVIYADYTNYKVPVYCAYCGEKRRGLTRISLREAKRLHPDKKVICADCNLNLELDNKSIPRLIPM